MKTNCSHRNSGFTLVELLVVIGIISILAGAVLMIINPTRLQRKSREAVLRSNTAKLCTALFACTSVKSTASDCSGSFNSIGVTAPTDPTGSSYTAPTASGTVVRITGTLASCSYTCAFNFATGAITNLPAALPGGCAQ